MPSQSSPVLVIAHRGARSLAPENTLAAAQKAYDLGADLWETDVSITADGELILMHDKTLKRTTNAEELFPQKDPWTVNDFTLAEIKELDAGIWYNISDPFKQIEAGKVSFEETMSFKGLRVPTLREALELTKRLNWKVNLEIKKQSSDEFSLLALEKTIALLQEMGMITNGMVLISSFEQNLLDRAAELDPNLVTQRITLDPIPNLKTYLQKNSVEGINPKYTAWNYQSLKKYSNQGIQLNVWTVNDELVMKALINSGVNGIITDFPQLLLPLVRPTN
ncbi:MAG: glycerophosphodiester phosphodiesterase family protein [Anaerolineaceae bacterium]|nr:glycerophosphodiester phosphodiesterase family protein [Anaerolineaceae bacterium]